MAVVKQHTKIISETIFINILLFILRFVFFLHCKAMGIRHKILIKDLSCTIGNSPVSTINLGLAF